MMGLRPCAIGLLTALLLVGANGKSGAGETKSEAIQLRAQLIWGTNDTPAENPKHKEVGPQLRKKLQGVFKWKNYIEINRQDLSLAPKSIKRVRLSPQCEIEVRALGENKVAVRLFGEKKLLLEQRHDLASKEYLILGDHDKNQTAWFVVLSKIQK